MTTVRSSSHDRTHPAKRPGILTFGIVAAGLLGVTATLWSVGALRSPVVLEESETTLHTNPPTREEGLLPEAIYHRYDDCIVNAAAFCTTTPDA